ncbi:MAG: DNA cytosine methyltransferase [Candidatus Electrothrix aestuarii]|uniref:DNA (cytosine-5-)-methyltransferase n=1 Tax=Candidatus Electrothrix aestuarii TaxID=3062594 RepID=A0AAU8LWF4_9BACT|nr:DNA cytosine methyltransferase [Candidatus Electrothrix aestuarii]
MVTKKSELIRNKKGLLKAVDFFCGAGGMSYGLSQANINVLAGIDNDPSCRETYACNNKPAQFINSDISELGCRELADKLSLKKGEDNLIFVGCSPCQFWSKINTDKTKSSNTAFLLKEFQRFVEYFRPAFVVIENVPGLATRKKHDLLPQFHTFLKHNGYEYDHGVINANLFGVPQNRRRYLLIASRLSEKIKLPKGVKEEGLTVEGFIGPDNGFPPIEAGQQDYSVDLHTAASLSTKNLQRIKITKPDGGTRFCWKDDPELQLPAYVGKDHIFKDVYGRMFWGQPAPTITTRFNSLSNGRFGHPEEHRALSLREGATLQTFPKDYIFKAPTQATIARQIGNAVPPALAERIGRHLLKLSQYGSV